MTGTPPNNGSDGSIEFLKKLVQYTGNLQKNDTFTIGHVKIDEISFTGTNGRRYVHYVSEVNGVKNMHQSMHQVIPLLNQSLSTRGFVFGSFDMLILGIVAIVITVALAILAYTNNIKGELLVSVITAALGYIGGRNSTKK